MTGSSPASRAQRPHLADHLRRGNAGGFVGLQPWSIVARARPPPRRPVSTTGASSGVIPVFISAEYRALSISRSRLGRAVDPARGSSGWCSGAGRRCPSRAWPKKHAVVDRALPQAHQRLAGSPSPSPGLARSRPCCWPAPGRRPPRSRLARNRVGGVAPGSSTGTPEAWPTRWGHRRCGCDASGRGTPCTRRIRPPSSA